MTRNHRAAHVRSVTACMFVAAGLLAYGWSAQAARREPQPLSGPPVLAGEAVWEVELATSEGLARVGFLPQPTGSALLRVELPPGFHVADAGLVLEQEGSAARVLGSVAPGRAEFAVPDDLAAGARLVLWDFARDLRLGEAIVPARGP